MSWSIKVWCSLSLLRWRLLILKDVVPESAILIHVVYVTLSHITDVSQITPSKADQSKESFKKLKENRWSHLGAGSRQCRGSCSELSMKLDLGTCNFRLGACCAPIPCSLGPGPPKRHCLRGRWAGDAADSRSWFLLTGMVSLMFSSGLCQKSVLRKNFGQL